MNIQAIFQSEVERAKKIFGDKAFRLKYTQFFAERISGHALGYAEPLINKIVVDPSKSKSDEDLIDTIRHEICHILEPTDGHGAKWKACCRKIGCVALAKRKNESLEVIETNNLDPHLKWCVVDIRNHVVYSQHSRKLKDISRRGYSSDKSTLGNLALCLTKHVISNNISNNLVR